MNQLKAPPGTVFGWQCIPAKGYHVWIDGELCQCGERDRRVNEGGPR